MKIKKGDNVKLITGKDKGKSSYCGRFEYDEKTSTSEKIRRKRFDDKYGDANSRFEC